MTPRSDTSTILIVDDTPSNLGVVVDLFEDRGYRVAIAQDGEEGLQRAGLVQPDLILLDVMLPGADGFEICRRLKADKKTRDIPVIFMTALAATEHKVKGFEAGGVDYVTKPLQIDEVMARVCTHLELHAAQQKLEAQNAQLEDHREELEREVAIRTAELRESNRQLMDEIAERKAAEKRLRMMDFALNRVCEAAYLIEQQHLQFIYVNDEACCALGYSREELLAMTVYDIDPDASREEMAALTRQRDVSGSFVVERRHKAKDGKVFPVEIQSTLFNYEGRPVSIALARDITERKETERLLHEREEAVRAAVEHSPDAIARYDSQCRHIYVNPATQALIGRPLEEILGKTPLELSPLPEAEAFMQKIREVLETGQEAQTELPVHNAQGKMGWGHLRLVPEFGPDGAVVSVLSVERDITALKETERQLRVERGLFVAGPTVVFKWKAQEGWPVEYVSPNVADQFGYTPESLTSGKLSFAAIVHPDDLPWVAAEVSTYCEQGQDSYEQTYRIAHADGRYRWIYDFTTVVRGWDGAATHFLGYVLDITDRKQAEELAHEREQAFRALVENTPDVIVRWDRSCRCIYINPAMDRMVIDASKLLGKTPMESVYADSPEALASAKATRDAVERVSKTGQPDEAELSWTSPEGRRYHFLVSYAPEFDLNGQVASVVSISRDITGIKEAEHYLVETRARLLSVLKTLPDLVWLKDPDGVYLACNPSFEGLFGAREADIIGKTDYDFVDADLAAFFRQKDKEALAAGRVCLNEEWVTFADDGRRALLETRRVPVVGPGGKVIGVLGIGRDITERREADQRLEESRLQLRELAARRDRAREEERKHIARELHDELGQYLTGLSLKVSALDIEFGSVAPKLKEKLRKMTELVDATKRVVRNTAAALRPAALDMGLASAIEWMAEEFSKRTGVPCALKLEEDTADLGDMGVTVAFRIVQESLTNIARHAEASSVKISLERRDGHYVLGIQDDGKGFDVDVSKKKSFGVIGMEERLLMMAGSLDIISAPGQGTTVRARIPAHD